jgi:putative inorganic carbon (HCO3(-)) transporter
MTVRPNVELLPKTLNLFIILFVAGSVFSIALTQTALALALLTWAVIMIVGRVWLVPRTSLDYLFIAFVVAGAVSLAASAELEAGINFAKRILLIPIVYLIVANVKSRKFLKVLLLVLIAVMTVFSLIGVFKYLSGVGGLEGRLRLFKHYMTSGGILMMVSIVTFGIVLAAPPKRYRIIASLAGVTMVVPLVFTFTRSSWLGFLCGLSVMGILQNRKFIMALVAAVVIFMFVAPDSVTERAKSSFDPGHRHNIERVYMWKTGIDIIRDNPFTGVGDIDLKDVYEKYRVPEARENPGHLHNNFIMFGVIMGIPGLVVFVALFGGILVVEFSILHSIRRSDWLARGTALGAVGAFVGFHVGGLFEWNFGDAEVCMLFWLTVGLALAVRGFQRVEKATDEISIG